MTGNHKQNAEIARITLSRRRMDNATDIAIHAQLVRSAREAARYEKQAATLKAALTALRHVVNHRGWTHAEELTGYSQTELAALLAAVRVPRQEIAE